MVITEGDAAMEEGGGGGAKGKGKEAQTLSLGPERFSVPELLFHPVDAGIDQQGVAGCVADAVAAVPSIAQPSLLANVRLVGGTGRFRGFRVRANCPPCLFACQPSALSFCCLVNWHATFWFTLEAVMLKRFRSFLSFFGCFPIVGSSAPSVRQFQTDHLVLLMAWV
jgi:hypothetical protein